MAPRCRRRWCGTCRQSWRWLKLFLRMLEPLLVKWSIDEERWIRDNCKAFAALKVPAPAPSTASPAPTIADASPALQHGPKRRRQEQQTSLQQKLRCILRALNQMILSSATPGARRAHVELKDEGRMPHQGEGGQAPAARNLTPTTVCSGSLVWLFSPIWDAVPAWDAFKLTLQGGWFHLSFRWH